ncbi:MAG: Unknown protein [uncultured Sulfurovum sp.]|uniref:Histidine kinase/HSP90-like ATPase domain-containing protein n=1 Tax=uncultured Sulfurovum sp. TaxID=269237 RepID=A0A6S6SKS2_9BACT|nr:MAG: Unknown protein [uncultured Sulfurovum sp.]
MHKDTLIISSRIEEIPNVYEWIEIHLNESINKKQRNSILLITQEIVTNAIFHGNEEIESKKIIISFSNNEDNIVISIQDEGKGYPPLPNKEEAQKLDYLSEGSRGLKLAVLMCKSIEINKNLITLTFEK